MAKGIKIPITAPGAAKAKSDIRGVADAEKRLGKDAKKAGKDAKGGMKEASGATDEFTDALGVNKRMFSNWKVGIAAGIAAAVAGLKAMLEHVSAIHEKMRETYREFSDMALRPSTISLAQVREESATATAKWKLRTEQQYTINPEQAGAADFGIRSGLKDEFSPEQLAEVSAGAFKTMRVFGAGGGTVAQAANAAVKAGVARTPGQVNDFLAKVGTYAAGSNVDFQGLATVVGKNLKLADSYNISPDRFLAMAAAMSFQIKDPGELSTALERILISAGKKGPALQKYADRMGRKLSDLSAVDIIDFQSSVIAAAEGPQAKGQAAKGLGIEGEMAALYGKAYGPETQAAVRKFMAAGGATFADVQSQYDKARSTMASRAYAARAGKKLAAFEASESAAMMTEVEDLAAAEVSRARGAGENILGVSEDIPGGQARAKQMYVGKALMAALKSLMEGGSLGDADMDEASRRYHMLREGGLAAQYQDTGMQAPEIQAGFQFVQRHGGGNVTINNGGVHFSGQYSDPAGVPQPTGME